MYLFKFSVETYYNHNDAIIVYVKASDYSQACTELSKLELKINKYASYPIKLLEVSVIQEEK